MSHVDVSSDICFSIGISFWEELKLKVWSDLPGCDLIIIYSGCLIFKGNVMRSRSTQAILGHTNIGSV